jgi:hypothetical protein
MIESGVENINNPWMALLVGRTLSPVQCGLCGQAHMCILRGSDPGGYTFCRTSHLLLMDQACYLLSDHSTHCTSMSLTVQDAGVVPGVGTTKMLPDSVLEEESGTRNAKEPDADMRAACRAVNTGVGSSVPAGSCACQKLSEEASHITHHTPYWV